MPPPLSKQDEDTIMNKIIAGAPVSTREPLITHNLRLVVYIAKKFDSSGVPIEDLISIGSIGLILACKSKKCGNHAVTNHDIIGVHSVNKLNVILNFNI